MAVLPKNRADRLRWAVVDSLVIARRDLTHWIRRPTQVVGGMLFPAFSILLFGYVFGSSIIIPGGGDYREFLMPGLFGQTMMFGIGQTMTAVTTDADRGVTDRFRSLPMSKTAVVAGRSIADIANSSLDLLILMACGLIVGWTWHGSFGAALAGAGLLLLLRFGVIWVGIYIGLVLPSPESVSSAWMLLFPFTMIANTFVLPSSMPDWLRVLAEWNPLSATVGATRELFGNPGVAGDSWVSQHYLLMAVVWPVLLVAIFLPLSIRRYRRLSN
ncbi:multidrug ABC transporter permease [Amycolatopsis albispora]|uniref:Transport permease protein n=2 Tax=Amycolatopsis albispora TaxID=1804986 RepID=A0A344LK61_9PSEU|nr:multidrug ABC transporter permease [Amycolatopsis albispora]